MRRITFPLGLGGRIVGLVIAATLGTGVLLGALIIERGRDILRQKVLNDNLAAVTVVAGFIAEVVDEERNGILQMAQQP
ncbi:MAG: hypothetical protein NTZ05_00695, partial [Chloroflexi bacterium]|nr:hypothetical protein [Chloroflexota bacterium]